MSQVVFYLACEYYKATVGLGLILHEDVVPLLLDTDGLVLAEAADGLGDGQTADVGGDLQVLQVVMDKADFVVRLPLVQGFEGCGEGLGLGCGDGTA